MRGDRQQPIPSNYLCAGERREERIDAEELIRLLLLGTYNIYIVAVGGVAAAAIAPSWPGVKRWTWSMDPGEKVLRLFFFFFLRGLTSFWSSHESIQPLRDNLFWLPPSGPSAKQKKTTFLTFLIFFRFPFDDGRLPPPPFTFRTWHLPKIPDLSLIRNCRMKYPPKKIVFLFLWRDDT